MSSAEYVPFVTDCPCNQCSGYRRRKQLEDENRRLTEQLAEREYGKNWKNIMSGMGDQ